MSSVESSPLPNARISKALVAAVRAAKALKHDKKNAYQSFTYTSAEALIAEARKALSQNGLVCFQAGWGWEPIAARDYTKYSNSGDLKLATGKAFVTFTVLHESGESIAGKVEVPVIPEKGRPEDKAMATALTMAESYYLRSLLMIPRSMSADEMNARNDGPADAALAATDPKKMEPRRAPQRVAAPKQTGASAAEASAELAPAKVMPAKAEPKKEAKPAARGRSTEIELTSGGKARKIMTAGIDAATLTQLYKASVRIEKHAGKDSFDAILARLVPGVTQLLDLTQPEANAMLVHAARLTRLPELMEAFSKKYAQIDNVTTDAVVIATGSEQRPFEMSAEDTQKYVEYLETK